MPALSRLVSDCSPNIKVEQPTRDRIFLPASSRHLCLPPASVVEKVATRKLQPALSRLVLAFRHFPKGCHYHPPRSFPDAGGLILSHDVPFGAQYNSTPNRAAFSQN